MELLIDAGKYRIMTPKDQIASQMMLIEDAARTCHKSQTKPITQEGSEIFIRKIFRSVGHQSVVDHGWLVVKFTNICIGMGRELLRHRLIGASEASTRYVDFAKSDDPNAADVVDLERFQLKCVGVAHKDCDELLEDPTGFDEPMSFRQMMRSDERRYRTLRHNGWVPQDARQKLPIATETQIVISADFREWRHILKMRTHKSAHWEIRRVMGMLLEELIELLPVIFDDFRLVGHDTNGVPHYMTDKQERSTSVFNDLMMQLLPLIEQDVKTSSSNTVNYSLAKKLLKEYDKDAYNALIDQFPELVQ